MNTVRNPEGSLQTGFDKSDVELFNHENRVEPGLPAVRGRIVFDNEGTVLRAAVDGATEAEESAFWAHDSLLTFRDQVWQFTADWAATKEGRYQ